MWPRQGHCLRAAEADPHLASCLVAAVGGGIAASVGLSQGAVGGIDRRLGLVSERGDGALGEKRSQHKEVGLEDCRVGAH